MKVPQQLPNFGRQVPLIDGQRQNQINQQVSAALTQLSMSLYVQRYGLEHPREVTEIRNLAKDCQVAAKCYFEALGVLKIEEEQE